MRHPASRLISPQSFSATLLTGALHSILFLACLLLLCACQRAETKYTPTLERAALMQLAFPGWGATGDGLTQTVDLSAIARKEDKSSQSAVRAEISPKYVVRLDDTHAVMLTEVMPGGQRNRCHGCSVVVGAYFFTKDASGWRLSSRQDGVVESGAWGDIGTTGIVKIAQAHYALTIVWGSCWNGYCGDWLVVAGLQKDKATLLTQGIPLLVNSDGAYGSCSAIDDPSKEDEYSQSHECVDIQGKWMFQGKRLIVNFQGRIRPVDDDKPLPVQSIKQTAIYELVQDKLQLVKGTNPVPKF